MERIEKMGLDWIIPNVTLVVLPVLCLVIVRFVAGPDKVGLSDYFSDILLLAFSITCNFLVLCIEKYKVLSQHLSHRGFCFYILMMLIDALTAIASLCVFFYTCDAENEAKNGKVFSIIVLLVVFALTIYGRWVSVTANALKDQLDQIKKNNCFNLFAKVSCDEYTNTINKFFSLSQFTKDTCCSPECYQQISADIKEKIKRSKKL